MYRIDRLEKLALKQRAVIYDIRKRNAGWGILWHELVREGNPHFGMGHYTRGSTEPCLLGIKGRMPVADKSVRARIDAPVREHSRKPDEQYEKIERLYPDVLKLEMFARQQWPGWDIWGFDVENSVEMGVAE